MLSIADLDLFYGDAQALYGVSLDIAEREIVAIVGANGAGKTSLIRTIAGMQRPARGAIRFEGKDIAGQKSHRICELGIGQVAEGRQIFPNMSVLENLEMGAVIKRARREARRQLERSYALFPRLAERRRQSAGTLSGGERQMLALGRALMSEPRLLLLDEPSLGLAPAIVETLYDTLWTLHGEGLTLLLAEQSVPLALEIADYAYVLQTGRTVLEGPARQLEDDPQVQKIYLGIKDDPEIAS
jgi:branched-chain amino acid transport system ATP-binding protein